VELDIDNPAFLAGLRTLRDIVEATEAAKAEGGLFNALKRVGLSLKGAATFLRLYMLPVKQNPLPDNIRLNPAW
jgi:magnesium-protoporphyrin IX monomethyl ester (oxidative) cyclase